jgi:hypothetical protein
MLDLNIATLTHAWSPSLISYSFQDQENIQPVSFNLCQQGSCKIIQLVEVPPPRQLSAVMSSSGASLSWTCSAEDNDPYSLDKDHDAVCASYYSPSRFSGRANMREATEVQVDDTCCSGLIRVFSWRETFTKLSTEVTWQGMYHGTSRL